MLALHRRGNAGFAKSLSQVLDPGRRAANITEYPADSSLANDSVWGKHPSNRALDSRGILPPAYATSHR